MPNRLMIYLAAPLLIAAGVPANAEVNRNAQLQAPEMVAAGSGAAADKEKKVCRKLMTSGSRLGQRVCLSKSEWKKVEAQN